MPLACADKCSCTAGAAIPNTCDPIPSQMSQDWNNTCVALRIIAPLECAAFMKTFNQNNLQAFPAVASEALQADFQVLAASGAGLQFHQYCVDKPFRLILANIL